MKGSHVLTRAAELFCEGVRDKVFWMRLALATGLLLSMIHSRRLWLTSPRFYPTVPVFGFLPAIPFPLDFALFALMLVLIVPLAFAKRLSSYVAAFLILTALLVLWDQSRLQPWFYQYAVMLAALGIGARRGLEGDARVYALNACRLVVAAVYFWGGIQKLNYTFVHETLPVVMQRYAGVWPGGFRLLTETPAGLFIPLVEVLVGVGLLTRRFRGAAVVGALLTHLVVLLLYVPFWRNKVIWPWNAAMMAFVITLFWRDKSFSARDVLLDRRRVSHALVFTLFVVMPCFGLFGLWDAYLSASLYSGNTSSATFRMSESVCRRLPQRSQRAAEVLENGECTLHANRWSYAEMSVPFYPEPRIYRALAARLCAEATVPSDVILEIRERPRIWDGTRDITTLNCADIGASLKSADQNSAARP
jgi:hypothetical protein